MFTKDDLDSALLKYRRDNFKTLGLYAFVIYMILFLVDYDLAKRDMWLFFTLRLTFILPLISLSLFSGRLKGHQIDYAIMISFISVCTGVSLISYQLGGLTSDYYFGLIIVSFVQFAFTPLSLRQTIFLDIFNGVVFFIVNIYSFDFPYEVILKQLSNFLCFTVLKFIVVNRSYKLLKDALTKTALEEELKGQGKIRRVLGELCHLFNNPLFISMSILKNIKKQNTTDSDLQRSLNKALEANKRMEGVLKNMLEVQEIPFEKLSPDFLKELGIERTITDKTTLPPPQ